MIARVLAAWGVGVGGEGDSANPQSLPEQKRCKARLTTPPHPPGDLGFSKCLRENPAAWLEGFSELIQQKNKLPAKFLN